jgi:hypothetical protein
VRLPIKARDLPGRVTPALRRPGSIWPSQVGTAVSKDVWMLGIGLGLVTGALDDRRNGS